MPVREPAVAGQFYPQDANECRSDIEQCLSEARSAAPSLSKVIGGLVPHAGWVCSGAVAGEVIRSLAFDKSVETFVIFGAVHRSIGPFACVDSSASWRTPLGEIAIDEALANAVAKASPIIVEDPSVHEPEHSIEVEVPFIQHLAPNVKILPVMVPPTASAHEVGRIVAEQARALNRNVVYLASTDLTHYGPRYRFTPMGVGLDGLNWSKDVNDRRILDLILTLAADKVVGEAMTHRNACGSGAVAATIAASQHAGANTAQLLRHTTSYEVLRDRMGDMQDAVGYAGVLFGIAAPLT